MSPHRFLVPSVLLDQETAVLVGEEFHHLRVRRVGRGEVIWLTDGKGRQRRARVLRIQRDSAELELLQETPIDNESPLRIVLIVASIEPAPAELLLQKGTELGVFRFLWFGAARSVRRVSQERARRWQRILQEATKQAQRSRVPELWIVGSLQEAVRNVSGERRFLLCPTAEDCLLPKLRLPPPRSVDLAVGPEGGWTEEEIACLSTHGFEPVRLGPRTLRTETAALAATTVLQSLWGDFSGPPVPD